MQLTDVTIEGFRSIEGPLFIEVGSHTLLAGHNDAGKTAILDAIAYLLNGYQLSPDDPTYSDPEGAIGETVERERVNQTSVTGSFQVSNSEIDDIGHPAIRKIRRITTSGGASRFEVLAEVPENDALRNYGVMRVDELKARLDDLGLSHQGNKPELIARLDDAAAAAPKKLEWEPASAKLIRLLPIVQRFDATSSMNAEEAIRIALDSSYKAHLADDTIRGSVRELEESLQDRLTEDAEHLRMHIERICSDIGEVAIRPRVSLAGGLKATEVSVSNARGDAVRLAQAGAGRARRVALAVWQFNAKVIEETQEDVVLLYDEPDTHLDYAHQREFTHLLYEQSKLANVRLLVATHSMNLIDGLDIASVLHVHHEDFRTVADSLVDESEVGSHLGAIAASLGLRNTVLLNERLFVGVEGASEARALPVLFRLAMGQHLESYGIALWPCDNNEGALKFASYLAARGRDVAFVVDADSLTGSKMFSEAALGRHGLDPNRHCLFIGEPNELEDTFSDEVWSAAANELWPRADEAEWKPSQFAAHRTGKFSSQVLQMLREGSEEAPRGKPQMVAQLALSIKRREDVPASLVACFEELVRRAS